ncbi:MAG: hypothetical protein DRI57_27640 [Deltaproteobacteria bacterium]|nr:MAG: hypothetical protein DRI57_27640 [Deltaproteobacteria bacterium]
MRKSEVRLNEAQQITRMGSFERNFPGGEGYWSDEYYLNVSRNFVFNLQTIVKQGFTSSHLHKSRY